MQSWPGGMRISVTAPEGGLLVVNDTYYPGWTASVDGVAAPILWANHLFMGVPLEPGTHTVLLEYRPAAIPLGIAISLATLILLCLLPLVRSCSARRPGPGHAGEAAAVGSA
jgi:uncharacterized membrane protein YfhO